MKRILIISLCFTSIIFASCNKKSAESNNVSQTTKTNIESQAKTEYPKSIVALSPAAVEILYAVGAGLQISAVSQFSDYPEEAKSKPVVGGFDGNTLSIEKILSFEPDFVYLTDGMHNFLIESLNQYKIPYYLSNPSTVKDIENEVLEIGKITGHSQHAKSVVDKMEKELKEVQKKTSKEPPKVYYEVWNAPYISVGNSSFINDVIKLAGGKNIFDDISDAYPIVSEESIISRNPDIILIPASSGLSYSDLKNRNGWESITALNLKTDLVVDDNILSRPTPRITSYILFLNDFFSTELGRWGF